ncbi:hypothetical protein FB567DRAFT_609442 [Paraphoma chrysanthemicola]|uniref:Tat pathway signal sequence n=1 Tax=Paraphoma chrysanthemicola TaxID=798071 RepID=A0A8K0W3A7_9PLEO|nr:hypothetical protein FB567DRAFT_609442 [Paraphoma chrysanthemicola]
MDVMEQPTPTPDNDLDSLFVPESKDESMEGIQVQDPPPTPINLDATKAPSPLASVEDDDAKPPPTASVPQKQTEEEVISPFVQGLRAIEAAARAEMADWEPVYLGQASEESTNTQAAGAKRKASDMDTDSSDDDDDAASDVIDDEVRPIDPNSQKRPKLPIYHPGFALTEKITLDTLNTFIAFLRQAKKDGYKDSELTQLWNEIVKGRVIPYQNAVRLAVAGDTGVGKSALMNAILGVLNLTIESGDGGACTCVITEFCQAPSTQTAPYAAEVQFFCLEMCRKLVRDLFTQWYTVKEKQRQNSDDVDDEDLSKMSTARDCLNQLFADRLGFDSSETFMATATSAEDPKVLKQFMSWTDDIHRMFIEDGETSVHFSSSTPETLTEQYHPFTRECPNASFKGKPLRFTPWPLVQIVRVTLNSPILQQNVIIADVPGGSDVNRSRVENAARYLQECDMTIVVGKIDRLQDNASFRQQYMDAYRRRRSGSVILVATRSDDLNDEGGSTLVLDTITEELLGTIAQKITNVEQKIRVILNDIERNRISSNHKANKKLKEDKKKLLKRKAALEKERKDVRIACRSKQVARVVAQNYRTDTGDDANVPVFCVSNLMYTRYLRGYDKDNDATIPTMTIEETQIPALCSLLYSLPSRGRTASLDHFVKVSVQTLLSVVQMSCSTTTLARVNHLTAIVRKAREDVARKIHRLADKFIETDIKSLEEELADHAVQTRFDKHAIKCLEKWESLVGVYVQKKKNLFLNWNEELMSSVRPVIDQAFRSLLDRSCETFKAEAAQVIKEALRDLNHILKNDPKALACDAYKLCFSDNLKRYETEVTRLVEQSAKNLKDKLITIHLHTYKLREQDYFPQAMVDFYTDAYKVPDTYKSTGITMFVARCAWLKDNIPGPNGPFSFISGWVEEDSSKAMVEVRDELKDNIDAVLGLVQNAFERMKRKKDNDTEQGKKFRTDLHLLVAEARKIMDGVALETLELCKMYK